MSGAIEAGSAFVRFWGDISELVGTMKTLSGDVKNVAGAISKEVSQKMSGGFATAEAAAAQFGATATAAGHQVAASMTAAAAKTTGVWAGFQRIASSTVGIARASLTFGNIAKTAGIASWGLFGVSRVMRMMGKDTTQIDMITKALWRVSWAARAAAIAVGLIKLPGRVLGGITGLARSAGRGLGGLGGRVAGLGGLMALNSASAAPGEEGEQESTGANVAGSALTGFALGGAVGAAALGLGALIKSAISRNTAEGVGEATGFLGQLGAAATATGQWFADIFGKAKASVTGAFASLKTEGPSIFERLTQAVFPLVDAVENVWLPAFQNAVTSMASLFKSNTAEMERSWSDWIVDSVAALSEFVGNIDIYFQIAQQTLVMWASNSILQVSDLFTNIGKWLDWFGKNWSDMLFTAFDLAATVFINIGQNIRDIFSEIWEWVKSGFTSDFEIDWTPLTEGFVSTIKEWPDLVETELAESTPELDSLFGQLGERQAATERRRAERATAISSVDVGGSAAATRRNLPDARFGATSAQSQEGLSLLAQIQNKNAGRDPVAENTKQMVKEQKATHKEIVKVVEALNSGWDPLTA